MEELNFLASGLIWFASEYVQTRLDQAAKDQFKSYIEQALQIENELDPLSKLEEWIKAFKIFLIESGVEPEQLEDSKLLEYVKVADAQDAEEMRTDELDTPSEAAEKRLAKLFGNDKKKPN